jgi:hypothetical protein
VTTFKLHFGSIVPLIRLTLADSVAWPGQSPRTLMVDALDLGCKLESGGFGLMFLTV